MLRNLRIEGWRQTMAHSSPISEGRDGQLFRSGERLRYAMLRKVLRQGRHTENGYYSSHSLGFDALWLLKLGPAEAFTELVVWKRRYP
jgi:hypothetical protein